VKLFLQNSNLCDHDTSTLQPDRRTDGQLALAIPHSARLRAVKIIFDHEIFSSLNFREYMYDFSLPIFPICPCCYGVNSPGSYYYDKTLYMDWYRISSEYYTDNYLRDVIISPRNVRVTFHIIFTCVFSLFTCWLPVALRKKGFFP